MQKLQLYIDTERVDLFKDETVSFTQTIQNVRDIGKIFTEFTKTFSVPASKKNNIIFQHYYNFDIRNGFDARNKQDAILELNDVPFKTGKIKLEGVDLKNNVAHTYRITFFGNTVNLKDILGDDQLASLSGLDSSNQVFNTSGILDRINSEADDILVPLITHTDRMFYDSAVTSEAYGNVYNAATSGTPNGISWNQFKYAIRVQAIITAIETEFTTANGYEADIVFSDDFFNDATNEQFNELFLWLHRKKGATETSSQVPASWTTVSELSNYVETGNTTTLSSESNGMITVVASGGDIPDSNVYLIPDIPTQVYSVRVTSTAFGIVGTLTDVIGNQTIPIGIFNGTYNIQIFSATPLNFSAGGIEWLVDWQNLNSYPFVFSGTQSHKNATLFATSADLEFNITEQIPKMTIMNFLSGLFKMFNLTAYVDSLGIIVVRTLDSYYAASSTLINIDEYLDTTKSTVNVALPFKEISFSYKGLGTFLAKQFEQINNTQWGTINYTLNNSIYDAPSKEYKIELPFEHMMYERLYDADNSNSTTVQWGYFVDDNQESYFGLPLLFYPIKITGGTSIPILDTPLGSGRTLINNYFIPSNSLTIDCAVSKVNINFNNEINEYLANEPTPSDPLCFTDTLFESKYKTYVQDVFNEGRRIVKVTAYLPMKIYYNLQLNDLIELGQDSYKINSLTTNLTTGKTEFELLNTIL